MTNQSSAPLEYEPHNNLSLNRKTANECRNLLEIRYEIDTIDHFIVKLMRDRMQYALATLKFKSGAKPIPDYGRVIQQLGRRKEWAETYGLDPQFIESFFKSMIDWYMSQQIDYYKAQNPDEANIQIKLCTMPELKAMEYGLGWIDILHYGALIRSGYQKARKITEPVLVSFTQKTSIFSDNDNLTCVHPFYLFEQTRHLSLSHGFLLAQPSQEFFMLALGSVQQFDLNQNMSSFSTINKKIVDFTYQEFHSEVKEVVDSSWKRLLLNAVIENCDSGHGPVLTGGLCFDHQNTGQSGKWSDFGKASFVLPRVQFSDKGGNSYVTFNTIITKYDESEAEIQLIDAEIISLLGFCNQLLNGAKQSAVAVSNPSFDLDNNIGLNQKSVLSPDTWKQTVRDALVKINKNELGKVMLAREAEIEINKQNIDFNIGWSLNRLFSMYPSFYLFGVVRQGSCFIGATPTSLVRLIDNQFESITSTSATIRENKGIETDLLNSSKQQVEHNLVIELLKNKLKSITEPNSLVTPDKPTILNLNNEQHLYTSVRGTIRKDITLLDLVQTLHPIPAVGGFPQSSALKFIRENENLDRGWFGAPIGWIDAKNNGEFVIALTSALINEGLVSLFAGCNIVAHSDSDSDEKFHETNLKMKSILLAFDNKQATI